MSRLPTTLQFTGLRAAGFAAGLLATGLALPGAAWAQDDLKPEVMLMIDGSRLMGKGLNLNDPICDPAGTQMVSVWRAQTPHTPLNMVKEALLGTVKAPRDVEWCTIDGPAERAQHDIGPDADHGHARQMCCRAMNNDACQEWAPCYPDNGRAFTDIDSVDFGDDDARRADGLIAASMDRIKFGLMFTDGNPDARIQRDGNYSYGDEPKAINGQPVDLGARRAGTPRAMHVGALVAPGSWFYGDDDTLDDGDVGDVDELVRRHNRVVQAVVSRLVPHGDAPLSAFVHDAVKFYEGDAGACRARSAILITRGFDAAFVAGLPGFPYDPAADYARQLRAAGVTLHVVLVAPAAEVATRIWGEQLAAAGGGEFAHAQSAADIRVAIGKLARSSTAGRQARSRPLVVSATAADYCDNGFPCAIEDNDVLQWRINAYTEVINGTGYGRVDATELSCDDALADAQRPGVPQPRARPVAYDEALRLRGDRPRRSFAVRPDRAAPVVLTGGALPVFHDNGAVLWAERDVLAQFLDVPRQEIDDDVNGDFALGNAADADLDPNDVDLDGVAVDDIPADPRRVRAAGLLVNGHFGARGLGDGARRQLGAMLTSDLVALRAPALGLNDPGYIAYRNAEEQRKTLIAAGARDGLLHIFRASDGVEVLNFMPRDAWGDITNTEAPVDGPLNVADIVPCRALNGGGNAACPDQLNFEPWLFGGVGREGASLFGVRLSAARALTAEVDRPLDVEQDIRPDGVWDVGAADLANPGLEDLTIGSANSRPAVTHVRDGNVVRAALIVGCGKGPDGGSTAPGRCVLVLEATTGRVIRRFDLIADAQMGAAGEINSFTGSPVTYPAGGIAPASRAYIGDAVGRLWRMDLRDANPDNWSMSVAWPPQGANANEAGDYVLGRAVVDRPSIALRPDGALAVAFATDRDGEMDGDVTSFAVSFTDRTVIDDDGVTYNVTRNWLLPLSNGEYATGSPVVRDEIVYITTRQSEAAGDEGCGAIRGRLYGVHYYKTFVDAEGNEATFTGADGKVTDARPALSQFNENGPAGEDALSIILPPGRVAYGLAIARTPSCSEDAGATTDIILNVADEQPGAQPAAPAGAVAQAKVEVVQGGAVVERPLDGSIFMRGSDVSLEICIDCDASGQAAQGAADNALPPFPTQVVYWGSTFLN